VKGHIRKRGKRSWAVVLYLGRDPATGKKQYKWHRVNGTKRDAERALAELLHQVNTQQYAEPSKLTLGEYLEEWLDHASSRVRPSTWQGYATMVRRHITPVLGNVPLSQLTPRHVQRLCDEQLKAGRADGRGKKLSHRTVQYVHAVLYRALKHAVELQLVARNVAAAVKPPRPERREVPVLDQEVATRLLKAAEGTRLYVPILLAVSTGMRRGEVLGLRWKDVDLEAGTASIQQTLLADPSGYRFSPPKSAQGRRRIALPEVVVDGLRTHRRQQLEYRLALGPGYDDHDLVVCLEDGRPWAPNGFRKAYRRLTRKLGLDEVRFHDLRHLHATTLLRKGIHPKVVADRLGHAEVRITLDTYSHVLPDIQQDAARAMDEVLSGVATGGEDDALAE